MSASAAGSFALYLRWAWLGWRYARLWAPVALDLACLLRQYPHRELTEREIDAAVESYRRHLRLQLSIHRPRD